MLKGRRWWSCYAHDPDSLCAVVLARRAGPSDYGSEGSGLESLRARHTHGASPAETQARRLQDLSTMDFRCSWVARVRGTCVRPAGRPAMRLAVEELGGAAGRSRQTRFCHVCHVSTPRRVSV